MLAARMHGYKRPLVLEEVKISELLPDQDVQGVLFHHGNSTKRSPLRGAHDDENC